MRVRFLPAAELEFIRELAYYSKARPGTAEKFGAAVEAAARMAKHYPQGGARSFSNTRTFRIQGFPFSMMYRATTEEILGVAIAPHSKKPNYWATRVND